MNVKISKAVALAPVCLIACLGAAAPTALAQPMVSPMSFTTVESGTAAVTGWENGDPDYVYSRTLNLADLGGFTPPMSLFLYDDPTWSFGALGLVPGKVDLLGMNWRLPPGGIGQDSGPLLFLTDFGLTAELVFNLSRDVDFYIDVFSELPDVMGPWTDLLALFGEPVARLQSGPNNLRLILASNDPDAEVSEVVILGLLVPEPTTLTLLSAGLLGAGVLGRRRRQS